VPERLYLDMRVTLRGIPGRGASASQLLESSGFGRIYRSGSASEDRQLASARCREEDKAAASAIAWGHRTRHG
jgi:hypothetical protein